MKQKHALLTNAICVVCFLLCFSYSRYYASHIYARPNRTNFYQLHSYCFFYISRPMQSFFIAAILSVTFFSLLSFSLNAASKKAARTLTVLFGGLYLFVLVLPLFSNDSMAIYAFLKHYPWSFFLPGAIFPFCFVTTDRNLEKVSS